VERVQSPGEEIANSVSAGVGLIGAIAGIPLLLASASQRGSNWPVAGALVFAATTLLLYLASTIYHALPRNRAKRLFRLLDHMAIFLLIAGTYTPYGGVCVCLVCSGQNA
jgi:hemolysin III